MIKVFCRKCGKELKASPPETEDKSSSKVYKMHLCLGCYFKLMDWFENRI